MENKDEYDFNEEKGRVFRCCPKIGQMYKLLEKGILTEEKTKTLLRALINTGRYRMANRFIGEITDKKIRRKMKQFLYKQVQNGPDGSETVLCTDLGCGESKISRCFCRDELAELFPNMKTEELEKKFRLRTDKKGNPKNSPCEVLYIEWGERAKIGIPLKYDKKVGMWYIDKSKFSPDQYTNYILEALPVVQANASSSEDPSSSPLYVYDYDSGFWHNIALDGDIFFFKLIKNHFNRAFKHTYHREYAKLCLEEIEGCGKNTDELEKADEYINTRSCIIRVDTQKGVLKPRKHTPKIFSTNQIPVNVSEEAECPKFMKFLNDIFDGDEECVNLIQEIMGYCLCSSTKAEKMFIFHGEGANGKSILCSILMEIFGKGASALELGRFKDKFALVGLVDKYVNISTENDQNGKEPYNTENLKKIVSGDPITVEPKYQNAFTCRVNVKLINSVNRLPLLNGGVSEAIRRRLMIVPFEVTFTDNPQEGKKEKKKDPFIIDELKKELEGILMFALKGYLRLRMNNYQFSPCKKADAALQHYIEDIDCMRRFVDEMLSPDPHGKINKTKLRESFKEWCREEGFVEYISMSTKTFRKELMRAIEDMDLPYEEGRGENNTHALIGCRLKEDEFEEALDEAIKKAARPKTASAESLNKENRKAKKKRRG